MSTSCSLNKLTYLSSDSFFRMALTLSELDNDARTSLAESEDERDVASIAESSDERRRLPKRASVPESSDEIEGGLSCCEYEVGPGPTALLFESLWIPAPAAEFWDLSIELSIERSREFDRMKLHEGVALEGRTN